MSDPGSPLLNVFEVVDDATGGTHNLVCLTDPMRAGIEGINPRTIVGEIPAGASTDPDDFDPGSFLINPAFVEMMTQFLNEFAETTGAEDLAIQARAISSGWLYVIDPRFSDMSNEPGPENVIGAYPVDDSGQIVPRSFLYNEKHKLFDETLGVSALLENREFFDWLNPVA